MSGIGLPDWYNIKKASAVSALGDLGELAARLGSSVTFDRRGDVIFLESFENGLIHVKTELGGAGAAVATATASARTGGYSAKLTAGSDGSKFARVRKELYPISVDRIGFEFSWARVPTNTFVRVALAYFPKGVYYYGYLQYDSLLDVWQYLDSAAAWQDLETSLVLYDDDVAYHTMKLVVDFGDNEYVRVLLDGFETDLAGVGMRGSTSALGPFVLAYVELTDQVAVNPYIYVDDLIVTINEP